MANEVKFCVVCGKKIPALSLRRKVCSDFCRRRKKAGYAPYLNYELSLFGDLTDCQKEAQKRGMSYGQYVASLTNTERKDKDNG